MQTEHRKITWKDVLHWFDPRYNQAGSWAFSLNRLTAIGLTVYLYLHLIMLYQLSQGPEAYNNFVKLVGQPWFLVGELLVVIAGFIHGLNGIRIALNSFGYGVPAQKKLFYALMAIAALGILIIGIRMFTA
jgi:succinate dehydrogenase / fumarate reductase, cytochrome b subunit